MYLFNIKPDNTDNVQSEFIVLDHVAHFMITYDDYHLPNKLLTIWMASGECLKITTQSVVNKFLEGIGQYNEQS